MNDYLAKQPACTGALYGIANSAQSLNAYPAAAPPKRSALEEVNNQLQTMIIQTDLIDQNLSAFLSRVGGEGLTLPEQKNCATPQPSSALPQLANNLGALKSLLNTLGEHVGKLNQIA